MQNYKYTEKCKEISGFGGGYEDACRKMVIAGMEWLDQNKGANPTFKEYKNVFGLTADENEDMKAMQTAMDNATGNESSGAMMQAATRHVLFAKENGWEKYIQEMEKEPAEQG